MGQVHVYPVLLAKCRDFVPIIHRLPDSIYLLLDKHKYGVLASRDCSVSVFPNDNTHLLDLWIQVLGHLK